MNILEAVTKRWTDPSRRPLFKGSLIDETGCCCAQGDILRHECRMSDQELRDMAQRDADRKVADTLGITRFQAVLLRIVNDQQDGCPQDVLTNPEKVIGSQAQTVLAFARHLDRMTPEQWSAARSAAWDAAGSAARSAAGSAAWDAARSAAGSAAWDAARSAARSAAGAAARSAAGAAARSAAGAAAWDAGYAMNEIQGADIMRKNGTPFYFLPLFGFSDPEAVLTEDAKHQNQ